MVASDGACSLILASRRSRHERRAWPVHRPSRSHPGIKTAGGPGSSTPVRTNLRAIDPPDIRSSPQRRIPQTAPGVSRHNDAETPSEPRACGRDSGICIRPSPCSGSPACVSRRRRSPSARAPAPSRTRSSRGNHGEGVARPQSCPSTIGGDPRLGVSVVAWLVVIVVVVVLVVLVAVFLRRRRRGGGVIATRRKR